MTIETLIAAVAFGAVIAGLGIYIFYFYLEDVKDLPDFED